MNQETIGAAPNLAYLTNTFDVHTGSLTDQLVTRAVATPAAVDEQAYTYDQAGNITSQTSTRLGSASTPETQCYIYDHLDRLTAAWTATDNCAAAPSTSSSPTVGDNLDPSAAYWTTWGFDAVGNRVSQVQHSVTGGSDTTTSYTYDGNGAGQPSTLTATATAGAATGSTSYSYDTAGNMTSRNAGQGNQTLTWDDAGQLTGITGGTAGDSHFLYDAEGNLLVQKDPGQTTLYLPDEQLTLDTATGATSGVRYYPLPGGGLAYRTGSGSAYGFEITDQHGTSGLQLDNTAQTPTWRQFTPYGAPRATTTTWPDNRGFLNKPTDTATGLTIIGARQYDPATGRFISLDPILEATSSQQLNGYTYAGDNPITQSDPTGLMICSDGICGSVQTIEAHYAAQQKAAANAAENRDLMSCMSIYCYLTTVHNYQSPSYAAQQAQQELQAEAVVAARENALQAQLAMARALRAQAEAKAQIANFERQANAIRSCGHWFSFRCLISNNSANIHCDEIAGVYCSGMVPAGPDYGDIRGTYLRLVSQMRTVEDEMRTGGASDEEVARTLVQMRNAAKVATRGAMNPEDVAALEARNMAKYGDPIGPTADYQFEKYGSWSKVIDAAYRTNPQINETFGFGSGEAPPADPVDPGGEPPIDPIP